MLIFFYTNVTGKSLRFRNVSTSSIRLVFHRIIIADIKEKDESTNICIMGNFIARTANVSDIMDNDDDLDFLNITADAYIPPIRTNMHCHVNNSEKRLIS